MGIYTDELTEIRVYFIRHKDRDKPVGNRPANDIYDLRPRQK